ncbi:hypothetical protein MLD38_030977 [Melastoma candidum]|uniref:Uncharacterized protein n=1 Tax=Melastoma candidum TaxID=119954 RepID=A0ACB9MTB2_9MYRT|nr:hypothetical protein MLD38_030977 [Melastoma candidum]
MFLSSPPPQSSSRRHTQPPAPPLVLPPPLPSVLPPLLLPRRSSSHLPTQLDRLVVKLKAFSMLENTAEALTATTHLIESNVPKQLRKFLSVSCDGEMLAVADSKLGNSIKEKVHVDCVHNDSLMALMRGVRSQLTELITGLAVLEW